MEACVITEPHVIITEPHGVTKPHGVTEPHGRAVVRGYAGIWGKIPQPVCRKVMCFL